MGNAVVLDLQQRQVQGLKQMQYLIMSHQMQQAIHMLQLPILELSSLIEQEIEQNPVIEYSEESSTEESGFDGMEGKEDASDKPNDAGDERELLFNDRDFTVMRQLDEDFRGSFSENACRIEAVPP